MNNKHWEALIMLFKIALKSNPTKMQKEILTNGLLMLGSTLCYEMELMLSDIDFRLNNKDK